MSDYQTHVGDLVAATTNHPCIRTGRIGCIVYIGNAGITVRWNWTPQEPIQHTEYPNAAALWATADPRSLDAVEDSDG